MITSIVYIGMDVHKETFSLCALDGITGEILGETRCGADLSLVEKFIENIKQKVDDTYSIVTGYEAGVLGYSLHNELEEIGIECEILAPSTMEKSAKNKLRKNDRMDAQMIARNLANGSYKSVYVPDDQDTMVKEYLRMIDDMKQTRKKIKQRIKALLLRHNIRFDGKENWSNQYVQWLRKVAVAPMLREIINEYLIEYDHLIDKIERLQENIENRTQDERYEQPVAELCCLKGVNTLTALTIQVEISDFSSFPTANSFAAYLGMIPMEHSSADNRNTGGITKQGNRTVRKALVESAQCIVRGKIGYKGKAVKVRQKGQDSQVIAYADKAIERLQRKYQHMIYRGKNRNVVIMAVARELACFIWGLETKRIQL